MANRTELSPTEAADLLASRELVDAYAPLRRPASPRSKEQSSPTTLSLPFIRMATAATRPTSTDERR